MKKMLILAAVFAAGLLLNTGCASDKNVTAMKCNGSCCSDATTCAKCCTDAAGCAKCCHKS